MHPLKRIALVCPVLALLGMAGAQPAPPATPPAGAPPAPATAPTAQPAPSVPKDQLPSAESLFEKHIANIGGEAKVRAVTSRIMESTVEILPARDLSRMTVYQKAPNILYAYLEQPGVLNLEVGFDGDIAWSRNIDGVVATMIGEERAAMKLSAAFYAEVDYKSLFTTIETVDLVDFGGKKCYKVRVVDHDGREAFRFFDQQLGLLLGQLSVIQTAQGPQEQTTAVLQYREFDGLLYAGATIQRRPGMDIVTTLRSVVTNPKDMPQLKVHEEIRAILAKHLEEQRKNPAPAGKPKS